jgi:Elongation factor Tu GTP binding domain
VSHCLPILLNTIFSARPSSRWTRTDFGSSKEEDKKPHINIVVIGHVDSGKSTTTGRKLASTASFHTHNL